MIENLSDDEKTIILARTQMIKALEYGIVTIKIAGGKIVDIETMSREKHETIKLLYNKKENLKD